MTINNKRKRRYKPRIWVNNMSMFRTSYKVTGKALTLEDITEYEHISKEKKKV